MCTQSCRECPKSPSLWWGLILWPCYTFPSVPLAMISGIFGSTGQLAGMVSKALSVMETQVPIDSTLAPCSLVLPQISKGRLSSIFSVHLQLLPYSYIFPLLCA